MNRRERNAPMFPKLLLRHWMIGRGRTACVLTLAVQAGMRIKGGDFAATYSLSSRVALAHVTYTCGVGALACSLSVTRLQCLRQGASRLSCCPAACPRARELDRV
jgi:hypothetical protein